MKKILQSLVVVITLFSFTDVFSNPIISNVSVSNITATTARINFSVNPQNSTTYVFVQINTTPTMSGSYPPNGPFNGTTPVSSYQDVTNLIPNTLYYYAVDAYDASSQAAVTITGSFTSGGTPPSTTNAVVSNITSTSAQIDFLVNTFGIQSTIAVDYGLSPTFFNSYYGIANTATTTPTPFSFNFTGLTPNTTYYYSVGGDSPTLTGNRILGSFTTAALVTNTFPLDGLVYRQEFQGNYTDTSTTNATPTINTSSLSTDDTNTANTAAEFGSGQTIEYPLNSNSALAAGGSNAQITISAKVYIDPTWRQNLPVNQYITFLTNGNSYMRFFRVNSDETRVQCGVFNNNPQNGSYGYFGSAVDYYNMPLDSSFTGWNTVTMTYGTDPISLNHYLKIYLNGNLIITSPYVSQPNKNIVYNMATDKLILGKTTANGNNFQGKLDNVFIYNRCLLPEEVAQLSSFNSLSSENFNSNNLKATIYPNPAIDAFTIEMENEVKSVEIYSLQGQKVMSSNSKNISVSDLSKGIYLVRIEDENNAVATQKLIIK